MKIVLIHPTGNRNVRAVINGLKMADMLVEFRTTIATDPKASWLKFVPWRVRKEFSRRVYPLSPDQIKTKPLLELYRLILPRIGLKKLTKGEKAWAGIDAVYQSLDKKAANKLPEIVKNNHIDAVYAYEDGALNTFISAKRMGLKCIYDLPIAYWETSRKLMMEEAERLPNWQATLSGGALDSPAKLHRKIREMELADVVIGPSQFVMDSLPDWTAHKKKILAPFGSPEHRVTSHYPLERKKTNQPLRVLFVGSMSQRKGLGDLFAAFRLLKKTNVELVVMGSTMTSIKFYRNEFSNFVHEHARPHGEVLKLMQSCDVFCLPSIVEGRALVMQEAMSQGLPLIITPNTGGADLIREGATGFLVPIRSPEAIAEKISWFADNRDKLPMMAKMAQQHAATYTWTNYSRTITEGISS